MRLRFAIPLAAIAAAFTACAEHAQSQSECILSGDELRAALNSVVWEVTEYAPDHIVITSEGDGVEYFCADGSWRQKTSRGSQGGHYEIDGNQFCVGPGFDPPRCRQLRASPDGTTTAWFVGEARTTLIGTIRLTPADDLATCRLKEGAP